MEPTHNLTCPQSGIRHDCDHALAYPGLWHHRLHRPAAESVPPIFAAIAAITVVLRTRLSGVARCSPAPTPTDPTCAPQLLRSTSRGGRYAPPRMSDGCWLEGVYRASAAATAACLDAHACLVHSPAAHSMTPRAPSSCALNASLPRHPPPTGAPRRAPPPPLDHGASTSASASTPSPPALAPALAPAPSSGHRQDAVAATQRRCPAAGGAP